MREGLLRYPALIRISLLAALLAGAACDNGDSPTNPTAPPTQTETFTGTVERNGSHIHTFNATALGRVTATITAVTPADAPGFGFSLGTWDATFEVCTAVMTNNAATVSSVLTGSVVGITPLCIRIFDANAAIPADAPVNYTVTVQRP